MVVTNARWQRVGRRPLPLELHADDGSWAQVSIAPVSHGLPYVWQARSARTGRAAAGHAPSIAVACRRAEETIAAD